MSAPATLSRPASPAPAAVERPQALRWSDAPIVGVLALVSVVVLVTFRREPVFSDDLVYWMRWDRLDEPSGMANDYRLAIVASAQLARLVFGNTLAAYNAVGILYGVGLVVAVYLLTRLLFPRVVAAGSALLLLTTPVFLEDATLLLPDWPSMFWFVAGLGLLVYAATRLEPGRQQTLVAAAAGLCMFLSLSVKDGSFPILIAVPLCLLLITDVRRAVRLTFTAAATSLLFLVVEFGILAAIYGEPLVRLRVILTGHVGSRTTEALGGGVERQEAPPAGPDPDLLTWGDLAERYVDPITRTTTGRWLLVLAGLALVVTLASRSRRVWFFGVPAIIGTGFVVFGVGSVQPIVPLLSMKFRYLSLGWVFLVPLIVIALWTLARGIAGWVAARLSAPASVVSGTAATVVVVAVGLLTVSGLSDALDRPVFVRSGEDGIRQFHAMVDERHAGPNAFDRIVTDGRTLNGLAIGLPAEDHHLIEEAELLIHPETSEVAAIRPGDLVIVNRKRAGVARFPEESHLNDPLPEDVLVPPPHWRLVGSTDIQNFRFYLVEEPGVPPDAADGLLGVTGQEATGLVRSGLPGSDRGQVAEQRSEQGVALSAVEVDRLRVVLGEGGHTRAPGGEEAELLGITEPGRLGVRVELHVERGVEVLAFWLRTYGPDGRVLQNSRMYQATDEERVSPAAFPTDGQPISFADHVDVDPAEDVAFRVVGFAEGTGLITVDRIAYRVVPLP
jgi:hypothetical protein